MKSILYKKYINVNSILISLLVVIFSVVSFNVFAHVEHIENLVKSTQVSDQQTELVAEIKSMAALAKSKKNDKLYKQIIEKINLENVTNPVLFLYKADAQQYLHQFDEALFTLSLASEVKSSRLMKANIYMTQGRYVEAVDECKQLVGQFDDILAITCYGHAISLNGELDKAHKILTSLVGKIKDTRESELQWTYTVLAEMSERLNDTKAAKDYYRKAIKLDADDIASRIALADLFFKTNESEKVSLITENHLTHDALLLRYVRSLNIQGDLTMNGYFCELKRRVLRYEKSDTHLHYDTQSEYEMYFTPDISSALSNVKQHWQQQKTPRDARLISTIGVLLGDEDTLDEIRAWKEKTKLEDKQLTALLN